MSKPILYVNIAVDDIRPEKCFGFPDDKQVEYIDLLHKSFGCKFTLFVPANYHGRLPLSENQQWVNYWLNLGYVELAAHGYTHDHLMGHEMEFVDCGVTEALNKFQLLLGEWFKAGVRPVGFRFPGWQHSLPSAEYAAQYFDYIAANQFYNTKFGTFVITNPRGIDEFTEDDIHNGFLKLHSHISLPSNNWLSEENVIRTYGILTKLSQKYDIKYIYLKDIEGIMDEETKGTRITNWKN